MIKELIWKIIITRGYGAKTLGKRKLRVSIVRSPFVWPVSVVYFEKQRGFSLDIPGPIPGCLGILSLKTWPHDWSNIGLPVFKTILWPHRTILLSKHCDYITISFSYIYSFTFKGSSIWFPSKTYTIIPFASSPSVVHFSSLQDLATVNNTMMILIKILLHIFSDFLGMTFL